ncbi:hypothetical protein DF143_36535 [Burkholderia cenocepacia]|uniref:hypothetical protein n=2 Tax=Burkholderia cenocepacia TaxID=95486 RepID=UPI000FAFDEBD|nr:hypothetical protein [Burkholderia cenocepacia]RQU50067.1 hypothetical protein DF143_36535 [Burkholderia cenocepacia]
MLNMNFWITNLLMPGDPASLPIATPQGSWQFVKMAEFARNSAAIRGVTDDATRCRNLRPAGHRRRQ